MIRQISTATLLLLAACGDGQPFVFDEEPIEEEAEEEEADGGAIDGDGSPPPGTAGPDANADDSILRSEAQDDLGGYVTQVSYNAASDSFTVDNIPFDGDRPYERQQNFDRLGRFALYNSIGRFEDDGSLPDTVVRDPATGAPIDQFDYRAIYGVSETRIRVDGRSQPRTRFAIVRTGSYADYGFGGFIYERNGAVEIPQSGQAVFAGEYAGLRTFQGQDDIEYAHGDVQIAVDFADFDDGDGVRGTIFNRSIYDDEGRLQPMREGDVGPADDDALVAPPLVFTVSPGTTRGNGEIAGTLRSQRRLEDGGTETFEDGTFMGIIAGEAEEIVGIVVVESQDPRKQDVTVQETGGFIVYR